MMLFTNFGPQPLHEATFCLLTAVPIGATQLGWYLYNKQVGFDFGMIAGVFSVILAGYLMYEKGWRDEDED